MPSTAPAILWFRNDLRLGDHAALQGAIESGRPVLPLFILDDQSPGPWAMGGASRWWLHHSLDALGRSLAEHGARLTLRRGDSATVIAEIADQTGAPELFTGGSADPWARRMDQAVAEAFSGKLHRMRTTTLFHPDSVRTKSGGAYGVYTPFANACLGTGRPETAAAGAGRNPHRKTTTLRPAERLAAAADKAGLGRRDARHLDPGRGRARWNGPKHSLQHGLAGYAAAQGPVRQVMERPCCPRTYTSARFPPSQLWHMAHRHGLPAQAERSLSASCYGGSSAPTCYGIIPACRTTPLRARVRPDALARRQTCPEAAWQRGQTGVPIVDAGMRQLWQIGWMHNRVRMITASFLIKHLMIPWQDGEAWFWDTLG